MSDRIDPDAVGARYAQWFTRGARGIAMRYLFSRRGLWIINTPYRRILDAASITAQDRVLDVGCGIGNLLIALAERTVFVHPLHGVDVSEPLIALGRTAVRHAGLRTPIELTPAPADHLPFAPSSFDVVITSHTLKHLDNQSLDAAFREVARVLRPGGRFLLWEFAPSRRSAPLFWSARLTGLPPPFRLRDEATLGAALSAAGFSTVHHIATGAFLMPPVPRLALLARTMNG